MADHIMAPIAVAELFDKISILEIKLERIDDDAKLANVRAEFELLDRIARELGCSRDEKVVSLRGELKAVNEAIWDAENLARQLMSGGKNEEKLGSVAGQTYSNNDRRAAIKRSLNLLSGSRIFEEKSHTDRPQGPDGRKR